MSTQLIRLKSTLSQDAERHHLIYSYFVESTGIVNAFRVLFDSYLKSDSVLKLNRKDDGRLIEKIKETMDYVYEKPRATITPPIEELRCNAYWRLFGYVIKGKESFPRVADYNSEFNKTLEDVMYQIFQIILDKEITIEKLGNADATAELLNHLRRQLVNRTYNEVEDIAEISWLKMRALLALLDDNPALANDLMNRLNIRSVGRDRRLVELGERLKIPVAQKPLYLFSLAEHMEVFLIQVEDTDWNSENTSDLASANERFFKEVATAWYQVTGKDFLAEALKARGRRIS